MKRAVRLWLGAVLLLTACGPGNTPTASVTASPSAMPSASATPSASPSRVAGTCHPCLALVTLRGSGEVVVRDITDIAQPRTIAGLGLLSFPGFVTGARLSSVQNGIHVVTMPLTGSPASQVADAPNGVNELAWSPDGGSVAYTTATSLTTIDIHLVSGGTDRVIGSAPSQGVGGCETIAGCTLPNWLDTRLAFSPDGRFLTLAGQGFGGSYFRVWTADGKLLESDDSGTTTMSAWSGNGLYFRRSGVVVWHNGVAVSAFLPRVAWIRPSASPAGGQIVFTTRDSSGWGHVSVVDTATRRVRELKSARTDALFLTSRYIWYEGERACTAADACGAHPPFHPLSGKTYIYDLQTGTEYNSIITKVYDVWPHAA